MYMLTSGSGIDLHYECHIISYSYTTSCCGLSGIHVVSCRGVGSGHETRIHEAAQPRLLIE